VEARPLRFQTSSEIALFLYEEIICRHGCPITIVSDNGKPFLSDLVKKVCHHYSIIHKTTTPYNPQSNGLIERFNRTLGQILQRRSPKEKQDWHLYLPAALFAYRSIKQESTKQSPFFLMYGYEPRTPFDNDHRIIGLKTPKFDITLMHRTAHQVYNLNRIRDEAATAIKQTQNVQKKAIEKKILEEKKELNPAFKIGDIVLLYKDYMTTSWSGKLQDKWEGPFIVHHVLGKGTFIVHHVLGKGTYHIKNANAEDTRIRRVHGNRLKIYAMPKVQWCTDNARIIPDAINLEDCDLFTHLMEGEAQCQQTRRNSINACLNFSQDRSNYNYKMNSNLIDLTCEPVEPVPINELVKSYFKNLYDTLGEEHTVDILNDFLEQEEKRKPNYKYKVNGTVVPRKEYVQEIINAYKDGHPFPEVFEDNEQRSPVRMLSPPKTPRLEPTRANLPVLSPVSADSVQIDMGFISMFEDDIKKSYQNYLDILREEAALRRKKEMAMRMFAHNVTEWSHLKFFHPRNDAHNIQQYTTHKNNHLKELLSYQSLHRPLLKMMKKYDRWTEMTSMFGDEHYRPRGF
jgi:sulfur carrier protein ThiS